MNLPDASRARAFDPWRSLGMLLCAASAALAVGVAWVIAA